MEAEVLDNFGVIEELMSTGVDVMDHVIIALLTNEEDAVTLTGG
jgi:hypothetical protein